VPVLADGHARLRAAFDAGITHVPVVIRFFPSELAAIQCAICLQAKRRTTTDGALYRLCEPYDRLMDRGGDRRSEEAKSKITHTILDSAYSTSSRGTAQLLGCNYSKVDKIRKIRKDGTPEIKEAAKQSATKGSSLVLNHEEIRVIVLGGGKHQRGQPKPKGSSLVLNHEEIRTIVPGEG